MKKRTIAVFFVVLALSLRCATASAAGVSAEVALDGNILDVKAQVNGQSVYLPVRAVCEGLGYEVTWSESNGVQSAVVSKGGDTVTLGLTRQVIDDNGHTYAAGVYTGNGLVIISGRMYLDSGLFSTIFPIGSSYSSRENRVTVQRRCENKVTVTTETMTSQKEHLEATIQYPQLSGLLNDDVQRNINNTLKQSALSALNEGEKNASDMAQAIRDGYTGAVGMCETFYNYMVQYNQNGLFSVVLTDYQYAGGAHGSTVQSSYTFDLITGKALQLSDLMDSSAAYTKFINETIRKEIDRRAASGALYEFEFSRFKDIGAKPEYYLSNDAIVFYFQEYAYFPYAAGIQEFRIMYTDLVSMIRNDYRCLNSAPVDLQPGTVTALPVGDIAQVILQGNATTGYTWHYTLTGDGVLTLVSDCYSITAPTSIVGAGGTYTWNFKALKAGEASITFKYYREWEGEQAALEQVEYKIQVT
jgi:inhibitor of cysteine peptidase